MDWWREGLVGMHGGLVEREMGGSVGCVGGRA